jgi:hypothetical protein
MASSSGLSPGFILPAPATRASFWGRPSAGLVLGVIFFTVTGRAALPDYLHEALSKYTAEVPAGWAYTQTTVRGDESTVERFDPSRPPAGQWTLLRHNGRAPGADELGKYVKFKAASAAPLAQAAFQKSDIDPGSIALVHDGADAAGFACAFRSESAGSDKMLGHLRLLLTVHKQPAYVERFTIELLAPYSPVLGVRMNALTVQMNFSPPGPDRPSLPAASTSEFTGRIFFFPTGETLRVTFTEFTHTGPPAG